MGVELWAARLDRELTGEERRRMLAFLPPRRRQRLVQMRWKKGEREGLCAYWILRRALAEQYQRQGELPRMAWSGAGKPWFPDCPQIHFSISHTEGAVLAGLSHQAIGVDIERARHVSGRLLRLLAPDGREEDALREWVCREAAGKRSGRGVGIPRVGEAPAPEGMYPLEPFPGYFAAAAACAPPQAVHVLPMEELAGWDM